MSETSEMKHRLYKFGSGKYAWYRVYIEDRPLGPGHWLGPTHGSAQLFEGTPEYIAEGTLEECEALKKLAEASCTS